MAKKKSFESKLKNNNLAEAFTNIAKGFEQLGEDNAQLLNKIKMNEDINVDEIDVILNKSRELSRLAQNINADEILRNRKKDRHIKLPFCIKARGTDLGKQFKKLRKNLRN